MCRAFQVAFALNPDGGGATVTINQLCALVRILSVITRGGSPHDVTAPGATFDEQTTLRLLRGELGVHGDTEVDVARVLSVASESHVLRGLVTAPLLAAGRPAEEVCLALRKRVSRIHLRETRTAYDFL